VTKDLQGARVLGDLHEEWTARRATMGGTAADAWYRREVIGVAIACVRSRMTSQRPVARHARARHPLGIAGTREVGAEVRLHRDRLEARRFVAVVAKAAGRHRRIVNAGLFLRRRML
jgi:hypothetical protein